MGYKISEINKTFCYSGIYKINYPDGGIYIGRTNNLYLRLKSHFTLNKWLSKKEREEELVKNDLCSIEILERGLNEHELKIREDYYIGKFMITHSDKIINKPKSRLTKESLSKAYYHLKTQTTEDMALQFHN